MASSNNTVATPMATIECDSTQGACTITPPSTGAVLPPGVPGRQYLLTNIGSNTARIGVAGATLSAVGTGTNADGQCDLQAGESIVLERGCAGFVYKSTSATTLRLMSGAG